jgi:hypothetical protein
VAPEDDNPRRLIEYLQVTLQAKYGATPAFFLVTLEDALDAATNGWAIKNDPLSISLIAQP